MMRKFELSIGDAVGTAKDFESTLYRDEAPSDEELKTIVIFVLRPDPDAERLIEDAEIDRDETGAVLIVNEGPNGECAPNGGPWLVARVEEVTP